MAICPVCSARTKGKNRFCSKECYGRAYKLGLVVNPGNFKKGSISPNKGRTLESWVGLERAKEIKERMSLNSRNKAPQLRKPNDDPTVMQRRLTSRHFHDEIVLWLSDHLRWSGKRVFVLSEYVREKRIPDATLFDGDRLIAIEVETEKRWKPSHASTRGRLSRANSLCGFFDETKVVFPALGESPEQVGPGFLAHITSGKD